MEASSSGEAGEATGGCVTMNFTETRGDFPHSAAGGTPEELTGGARRLETVNG